MKCCFVFPLHFGLILCCSFFLERVDVSEVPEENIDQAAVLTSNVLFFIIMFIFAVFETYVFRSKFLRDLCLCPASPNSV